MRWWRCSALALLLAMGTLAHATPDDEEVDHAPPADAQPTDDEEETASFEPLVFAEPQLSHEPHFFDAFTSPAALGTTWLTSRAKKETAGVEEALAKYDGQWAIGAPSDVLLTGDLGLVVSSKARHHAVAAKLQRPFLFADQRPLIVQYEAQFEQGQECGGGYLKLLSQPEGGAASLRLAELTDTTPYSIMFGPDKCGETRKVHFIVRLRNPLNGSISEHHARQPTAVSADFFDDHHSHLYTLLFRPDGHFSVSVDGLQVITGNANTDLSPGVTPPKQVYDPEDVKPADWDERAEIDDESATKPEDWDETAPREIVDASAVKPQDWLEEEPAQIGDPAAQPPADWDVEMDGEWEAPLIDNPACKDHTGCGTWTAPLIANPAYKGKWRRPRVKNPAYKGVWQARLIDNPHFYEPDPFKDVAPIAAIGIELWTMSERIIFDNVLVTDDEQLAADVARQTFEVRRAERKRADRARGTASWAQQLVEEKPWIVIVGVLGVLFVVVLIILFFASRRKTDEPAAARHKKDDDDTGNAHQDDHQDEEEHATETAELANTTEEEEDEDAEMEVVEQAEDAGQAKKAASRAELEESDEEEEEEEEEKTKKTTASAATHKTSPSAAASDSKPRRRHARKE